MNNIKIIYGIFVIMCFAFGNLYAQRQITFCGMPINITNEFVSQRLMTNVTSHLGTARMPYLRAKTNKYFPWINKMCDNMGMPKDLKYITIQESQFKSEAKSHCGAFGLWQFMPTEGKKMGLNVEPNFSELDERGDPAKATIAALKYLRLIFNEINSYINKYNGNKNEIWLMVMAAYNGGGPKIKNELMAGRKSFFEMTNLPMESQLYVYKIIAIKELWEFPRDYNTGINQDLYTINNKEPEYKPTVQTKIHKVKTENNEVIEIEDLEEKNDDTNVVYDLSPVAPKRFKPSQDIQEKLNNILEINESKNVNQTKTETKTNTLISKLNTIEIFGTIKKQNKKIVNNQNVTIVLIGDLILNDGTILNDGSELKAKFLMNDNDDVKINLENQPQIKILLNGSEYVSPKVFLKDEQTLEIKFTKPTNNNVNQTSNSQTNSSITTDINKEAPQQKLNPIEIFATIDNLNTKKDGEKTEAILIGDLILNNNTKIENGNKILLKAKIDNNKLSLTIPNQSNIDILFEGKTSIDLNEIQPNNQLITIIFDKKN